MFASLFPAASSCFICSEIFWRNCLLWPRRRMTAKKKTFINFKKNFHKNVLQNNKWLPLVMPASILSNRSRTPSLLLDRFRTSAILASVDGPTVKQSKMINKFHNLLYIFSMLPAACLFWRVKNEEPTRLISFCRPSKTVSKTSTSLSYK